MSGSASLRFLGIVVVAAISFGAAWIRGTGVGPGHGATLKTSLKRGTVVQPGDVVEFTVEATNQAPDQVSLALLNPPIDCVFTQDHRTASHGSRPTSGTGNVATATGKVRWRVSRYTGGLQRLTFRATNHTHPTLTTFTSIDVRVDNTHDENNGAIQVGDVTGDGVLDVIARASLADVAGVTDAGAVYVWEGATSPSGAPVAKLLVSGASSGDWLGRIEGTSGQSCQGIQLADVTGDGVLDVVVGASRADVAGVTDTGAIYVWEGGAALVGSPAPLATLTVAGSYFLGSASGQGTLIADVTGDHIPDIVACTSNATIGGVFGVGAVYVWAGGSTLTGSPATLATLAVTGAVTNDWLGLINESQAMQLDDVTGDGIRDVVVGACFADVGGASNTGAVYVWNGGATLVGNPAPSATLTDPNLQPSLILGMTFEWWIPPQGSSYNQGILLADVTGDGISDVIANSIHALGPAPAPPYNEFGAIFVWMGGASLVGSVAPTAKLQSTTASPYEHLGTIAEYYWPSSNYAFISQHGMLVADVNGDGVLDVVAGTNSADSGSGSDVGAVYVWAGGPTLVGAPAPLAKLQIPFAVTGDELGFVAGPGGRGLQVADVSADGVLDVVASAMRADVAGIVDAGAVYIWEGGPLLSTSSAPLATLTIPGASKDDLLGGGAGPELVDVTGDGALDVVVSAGSADIAGVVNAGALFVWEGGAPLVGTPAPRATLTLLPLTAGSWYVAQNPEAVRFADLTDDGVLDVVYGSPYATVAGKVGAGAIYAWSGGASLVGSPAPLATLTVPGAKANDNLGSGGIDLADVTGDLVLDLVATTPNADVNSNVDLGSVYVWAGGPTFSGSIGPLATMSGGVAGDQLGLANGRGLHLGDVTGDGVLDFVIGAQWADVSSVANVGAIWLFEGGALGPAPPVLRKLKVLGAKANDQLGF